MNEEVEDCEETIDPRPSLEEYKRVVWERDELLRRVRHLQTQLNVLGRSKLSVGEVLVRNHDFDRILCIESIMEGPNGVRIVCHD